MIFIYLVLEFCLFWFSDSIILSITGVKPLSEEQAPELFQMVRKLCTEMNLPMVKVYIENSDSLNAFATGRNPKRGAISFTRGLLETLSVEEITFVAAHELSHVKNRDTLTMAAASVLVGSVQLISELIWRSRVVDQVRRKDQSGVSGIIYVVFLLLAPFVAMFLQLAVSRSRELKADSSALGFSKNKEAAINGLKKLGMYHFDRPQLNRATASLYISNPLNQDSLIDRLFSTHPPIEKRIENIKSL
jgi:heat shock protein HtpX